jgi:4-amino-4-deoxy-L-arabinose transferase-like glycosyltransferase
VAALLTGLAVALRLAWVLAVPTRPVGDFAMYVESAQHLVAHGALPAEFIYMPGYVYVVAAIVALGGGLVAIKMIGVAAGGLATFAVFGVARDLFGRRAAVAAGLACALWPAGVAASSVTGTDMPAAALLALAVFWLVRFGERGPAGAPALFGLGLGLAAYVRAVALPLAALSALHFRARGARWRHVAARSALACLVAFLVLLPWGLRNRRVYGEFFLTDSHGGHTALVGANPNTDGTYSRSLNRQFTETTGYSLFAPPFRDGDRAAYALAQRWTRFSPKYALGLLIAKADRLFGNERALLYWPLYRQSVLPSGNFFDVHRAAVERLVDGVWYGLLGAVAIGVVAAASRRNWAALSLLPMALALGALYTVFFAEARYHLAIAVLVMPFAGEGMVWVAGAARMLARRGADRRRIGREAAVALAALATMFFGWPRLCAAGATLRDRYRWAVCVCTITGVERLCEVRALLPAPGRAPSPVHGAWDGFALRFDGSEAAAETDIDLPAGTYQISVHVDGGPAGEADRPGVAVELHAGAGAPAHATAAQVAAGATLTVRVASADGTMPVVIRAKRELSPNSDGKAVAWISSIEVETDPR